MGSAAAQGRCCPLGGREGLPVFWSSDAPTPGGSQSSHPPAPRNPHFWEEGSSSGKAPPETQNLPHRRQPHLQLQKGRNPCPQPLFCSLPTRPLSGSGPFHEALSLTLASGGDDEAGVHFMPRATQDPPQGHFRVIHSGGPPPPPPAFSHSFLFVVVVLLFLCLVYVGSW